MLSSFPLGILTLFPGQSTVLDCTASGSPPPTITWTRNGVPIAFHAFPSLSLASNGSLLLSAVTGSEEGNYSCIATNQEGRYEVQFALDIAGGVSGRSGVQRTLTGARVSLDNCSTESTHNIVMWLHGDRVVYQDEWMRVAANGTLLIAAARMEHAGTYKCLAANTRGWTQATILLTVKPRQGD